MLCAVKRRTEPAHTKRMREELAIFWLYSRQVRLGTIHADIALERLRHWRERASPWLKARFIELENMVHARLAVRAA